MRLLGSFKQFFWEEMDQSIEKKMGGGKSPSDDSKMDYFGGLGDEMGMEWKDIVSSMEKEPWVSSHFSLGSPHHEMMYKRSAWKIVPGTMSANGATIKLMPQKGDRSYLDGGKMLNKSSPDAKTYHLDRQQLQAFLTGGWKPAIDAAAQGGAGGMPGAPPPGGMPGASPAPGGM